jgi:DNA ligase D-like protein (predicted ligase)
VREAAPGARQRPRPDPFAILDDEELALAPRRRQPRWCAPMLATLVHQPFSDPAWVYERKLDGERALAFGTPGGVRLRTRNDKSLNATYPELVLALRSRGPARFVADGEVVAFSGRVTSFERLQRRMQLRSAEQARRSPVAVQLHLFDLLHLDGRDLTRLPLRTRKALLRRAFSFRDPLRFSAHRGGSGERLLRAACRAGWEGLIAKEARSAYEHRRSRRWLKLKCAAGQELVILGWTEPKGSRAGLGALLVGYHERGRLRYAGKVGSGFDERTLRSLRRRLARLERASPPLDAAREGLPRGAGVRWARPVLVAQVAFTEWTRHGKLRHPRFEGLRSDKDARAVVRER